MDSKYEIPEPESYQILHTYTTGDIKTFDMDEVEAILGSPMYFLQDELMITDEDFGLRIPSESKVLGDPIQIQNKIEFSAPEASLTDSINKAITFPSNIEEVIPAGGSCSNQEAQAQTLNLSRPSVIVHTSQFLPESKRKSQTVYSEEGLTHNRKNVFSLPDLNKEKKCRINREKNAEATRRSRETRRIAFNARITQLKALEREHAALSTQLKEEKLQNELLKEQIIISKAWHDFK